MNFHYYNYSEALKNEDLVNVFFPEFIESEEDLLIILHYAYNLYLLKVLN